MKPYRTDRIRQAMAGKEPPMTSEDLAARSGQSRTTVSKILGGSPNIRLESLRAVADALDLSMQELFEPKEEAAPSAA